MAIHEEIVDLISASKIYDGYVIVECSNGWDRHSSFAIKYYLKIARIRMKSGI